MVVFIPSLRIRSIFSVGSSSLCDWVSSHPILNSRFQFCNSLHRRLSAFLHTGAVGNAFLSARDLLKEPPNLKRGT
eukprot:12514938-Ditylum_brightwellii.AAC.1